MLKRSFTLISVKGKEGKIADNRFISSTPSGAAKKMFTKICRDKSIKGPCEFVIKLKETTQGSANKVYKYDLKRVKLKKPLIIKRGTAQIKIEYKSEIKSVKN
ncbi:hypothetical protein JO84_gp074 [Aureococcus anophagefferens virus]|uniref:Chromosomal protein MC1 domain-containing protein n=1 Tax=Aureococcus anophagefferens virus TaxID=1474867 RepID=A0A076FH36_9VIRU|nr:hypothetical protein JO84_gp074 [Aureococcus anophagefferens virus]AII17052.1 hypothetical protein AaV_074 [Aureococcus anophagefferens virus]UOG94374.1 hypothetical protein MKD35_339 [Aureococcus anophagefferens virus]